MVSERERGVWRRYRLAPVAVSTLIASTVTARYIAILTAGLLQLALAMALGMPLPGHPLQLWIAFTFVTFAFIGLGLVIAMLADNVPAVQALGQCIFLPMLIIGGIAVQLASLPDWALHVSAFFPGRYAVQAIQATVTGTGLTTEQFSLLALLMIGAAGALAGAKLFRWDAQQRFAATRGKGWLLVALGAWIGVGGLAELQGRIGLPQALATASQPAAPAEGTPPGRAVLREPVVTPAERAAEAAPPPPSAAPGPGAPIAASQPPAPKKAPDTRKPEAPETPTTKEKAPKAAPAPAVPRPANPSGTLCPSAPASWEAVVVKNIEDDLSFNRGLPPDSGVVTPIATDDILPEPDVDQKLQQFGAALAAWAPGKAIDPVQRVRNNLYAAAVPDVFQMDLERWVPWYVFDRIVQDVPHDDLVKILYWIACTPERGADPTVEDMRTLTLPGMPGDVEEIRNRAAIYGVKLLGRLIGKI
jgi:hypothetical protein